MLHLESEVSDFSGSKRCCSIDFLAAYQQFPLPESIYDTCGIVTPQLGVVSKRVQECLINSTSQFQFSVEPLFQKLRPWMKLYLDDSNLQCHTENDLLK